MAYSAKCLTEESWKQFGDVNCLLRDKKCTRLTAACRKVGLRMERYYLMKKELLKEERGSGDDEDNS